MRISNLAIPAAALLLTSTAWSATRVYDVDPAYRQEVVAALTRMFRSVPEGRSNLAGSVQLLPTGQILVDTVSDERQAEVAAVLEAIANAEPEPTPIVSLRYWVLEGVPGGDNTGNVPSQLNDAIRELESMYGELGIRVLESAMVSGRAGEQSMFESDTMELMQTAYVNGDQMNGNLMIETEYQELMVEVAIDRGDYLVLGSSNSGEGVIALVVNWPETN